MSFILPGLKGATGSNFQVINLTIASNTANYNVYSAAVAAGGISGKRWFVKVTIESGVYVYSTSTANPALDVSTGYPTNSRIEIVNNGLIYGAGGAGGQGRSVTSAPGFSGGSTGGAGGTGLKTTIACFLTNNGVVAGGGGGGGGGGAAYIGGKVPSSIAGSGGGGGRGFNGGAAGTGGTANYGSGTNGTNGTAGSVSAAGAGGTGGYDGGAGGALGGGGSAGQDGDIGTTRTGFAGGAAGNAIDGYSLITFAASGTITGPTIN